MRCFTSTEVRYMPGRHEDNGVTVQNKLPRDTKVRTLGAGGDDHIAVVAIDFTGAGKKRTGPVRGIAGQHTTHEPAWRDR